jgi:cell division protein FtsI (penicillin-binding protein 3)
MRSTLLLLLVTSCSLKPLPSPDLQAAVDAEVSRLASLPETSLAMVVVLDPNGTVLALGGQRGAQVDRTLPQTLRRDPGSVMKTFTIGAAIERGLVTPSTIISGEHGTWVYGSRTITDVVAHEAFTVDDVMAFSSNVGTAKVFALLGHRELEKTLQALKLPTPPMETDEAAIGVSYGADVSPTPLELAQAYAAIASGRAFPTHTAEVLTLLRHTVDRDDGTGAGARIAGVAVAGKTGTWTIDEHTKYADFVGILPAEAPRFVVLVGLESSAQGYTGGSIAAPAFARLGAKLLALH